VKIDAGIALSGGDVLLDRLLISARVMYAAGCFILGSGLGCFGSSSSATSVGSGISSLLVFSAMF
jgi:hypothetical protein